MSQSTDCHHYLSLNQVYMKLEKMAMLGSYEELFHPVDIVCVAPKTQRSGISVETPAAGASNWSNVHTRDEACEPLSLFEVI